MIASRDSPGFALRLGGLDDLKESRSGHHSAMGNLSELSSSPLTLFTFWSATPSPIIPVQMDVYLDSGPEQDFIVISVKCDSENIALGFHSAGKLLFSSVNKEITSCTHSGAKKRCFLNATFKRCGLPVQMFSIQGQGSWWSICFGWLLAANDKYHNLKKVTKTWHSSGTH